MLLGIGIFIGRRRRENFHLYLFFLLWFILGLGFHLQLFPLDLTVSDRWFYLPQVGLLGMIGVVLLQENNKIRQKIIIALIAIIIILLSLRTFVRTFDWRNGYALYSHDEKISRNSFDLENNLGVELFRRGEYARAKVHFEKSIRLSPKWWTSYNNLGAYYERAGNPKKAEELYRESITNGNYYLAYENLAFIYLKEKNYKTAVSFCEKSLRFLPYNSRLTMAAALAYYKNGNWEKAVNFAKRLYELTPNAQNAQLLNLIINKQPIN